MEAKRQLEICCTSIADAKAAERGGADRIELCEELSTGGLTPGTALLEAALAAVSIPVFVLVRPRGGHFVFDADERRQIEADIKAARERGCAGIVAGALTAGGEVDRDATRAFIEAARPLPFTFHRAFDEVADPAAALRRLRGLGADRILTAGGRGDASPSRLRELAELADGAPTLLACGAVRSRNVAALAGIPALRELHSAAVTSGEGGVDAAEVRALRGAWQ